MSRGHALEPNSISYIASIRACGKGSRWPGALGLLSQMQGRALEPNSISYIASMS